MVFLIEAHSVLCKALTESLLSTQINFSLQRVKLNAFVLQTDTEQSLMVVEDRQKFGRMQ
jgi:hypothetical protein